MSLYINANTEWGGATLSGITAPVRVMIAAWVKIESAQARGSVNAIFEMATDATGASPSIRLSTNASDGSRVIINGGTAHSIGTLSLDTWVHIICVYGGHDGTAQPRRGAVNGTFGSDTNFTATASTAGINFIRWGNVLAGGNNAWKGRIAQGGIWLGTNSTSEGTLATALQTTNVDAVSPAPNFSWRMVNGSGTAATGGVDLTITGSVADTDEPSGLTGGGGDGGGGGGDIGLLRTPGVIWI